MGRHLGNDLDLGQVAGTGRRLILPAEARSMHLHVCGGTGVGKSKFLEHLIRQDIIAWRRSRCGMLLLDPHGSLYDNVIAWLARHDLDRPVVPIDLRRDDWVVGYNLLRKRRQATAAVVVDAIIEAMAHVWGQGGTDQTPLFARWAGNVLHALYESGQTLAEAVPLLDEPAARRRITAGLTDRLSRRDWRVAERMTPKEFEAQVSSTVNRLQRFLRNELLRTILGQSEASLDLSQALEEGHIVLVSLAREKARVSKENAELFATLLLSDLWTAAQERGKPRDARQVKPFYLYLDEFQRFITPTIAEGLDEARGFGLHLTMAHQFPKQLRDAGDHGKRLYNSVMENATTKVVFRLSDEENLRPLAQWLYTGVMDPDQVKHELHSTKVLGYREEYRESHSCSTTQGWQTGWQQSTTESRGRSVSLSTSRSEGWNASDGTSDGLSDGENWGESETEGTSEGENASVTRGSGRSRGGGRSSSRSVSASASEGFTLDGRYMDVEEEEETFDERVADPRSAKLAWNRSRSVGASASEGESSTWSDSDSENRSLGLSSSRNKSTSRSAGGNRSRSRAVSRSRGRNSSATVGLSASENESEATTYGESGSESWSVSEGVTRSPVLIPQMGRELSHVQFRSLEEQLHRSMAALFDQRQRQGVVRIADRMTAPLSLVTPEVAPSAAQPVRIEQYVQRLITRWPFYLPMTEAVRRMANREAVLLESGRGKDYGVDEPKTARRKLR